MRQSETAEQRYRAAFERLKAGAPRVLKPGCELSQNNVALEAGATTPTALRKERFPALVEDIQKWVSKMHPERETAKATRLQDQHTRDEELKAVKDLTRQRDQAQSELVGAHALILELMQDNALLQAKVDALLPPPTPLRRART